MGLEGINLVGNRTELGRAYPIHGLTANICNPSLKIASGKELIGISWVSLKLPTLSVSCFQLRPSAKKRKKTKKMIETILSSNTLSHKLGKVSVMESCRNLNVWPHSCSTNAETSSASLHVEFLLVAMGTDDRVLCGGKLENSAPAVSGSCGTEVEARTFAGLNNSTFTSVYGQRQFWFTFVNLTFLVLFLHWAPPPPATSAWSSLILRVSLVFVFRNKNQKRGKGIWRKMVLEQRENRLTITKLSDFRHSSPLWHVKRVVCLTPRCWHLLCLTPPQITNLTGFKYL